MTTGQNPKIASDQVEKISDNNGSNDENDKLKPESLGFEEIIQCLTK